ncbi:TPA: prophage tail fiber N-terminal domain-containing protein [Citrobacter freundii]|nr:prophage tail fiber N-terminal domain-containing protein [Citrobacter freundii]
MPVLISGILKDGAGKPVQDCTIQLSARKTSPTVVVEVTSSSVTDANGHYSIEAEPGYYSVSLLREGFPPSVAGDIYVAPTDAPDTLNAFLDAPKDADLRPEVMKRFEEMVNRVVDLSGATEKVRKLAEHAAQSATEQAGVAKTSADTAQKAQQAAEASAIQAASSAASAESSAYIKDVSRHAVELASGGRQTVLYDDLGNPSVMNIIPIFRYEDLGYSEDMGAGVVSCFDVGTGANKSEIFIGAFQSSLVGSRAVSLPRVDPAVSVNFDAAKGYCANKGAGWHLMTMHEWAAISLWCMANGFEPRGNTNYGRAHDRYVERGRRIDGGLPGDTAGTARVHAGSGPDAWRHNNSPWGISDLVGNVWEWLDGFKLQDGQIIASTFNTQAEANWAAQAAYFDSTLATGGAPRLSDAVVNRLGTIGDNTNSGYSANENFAVMAKKGTYVSNQLLKRLLVEPSTVLPKGRVYMRNFGERLPSRGGYWYNGSGAGLAALYCNYSRVNTYSVIGVRLAFA